MELNQCIECKKNLNGRKDKKFCDDGCRNNYNNKINSDLNKNVKEINKALRNNRNILLTLLPNDEKTTVSEKTLRTLGFNFDYITHIYKTKIGTIYYFIYEFGYLKLENNRYMLVKNKTYITKKD